MSAQRLYKRRPHRYSHELSHNLPQRSQKYNRKSKRSAEYCGKTEIPSQQAVFRLCKESLLDNKKRFRYDYHEVSTMKSSVKAIGANIRALRTERSMTQDALAEALFVTRQTVSNYETGKSNPDISTLLAIAEVLDTDIDTLIYGQIVSEDTKAANRALIKSATVCAVLLIVSLIGQPFLKRLAYNSFIVEPLQIFRCAVIPILMICGGWLLIALLKRFAGLKPLQNKYRKPAKIVLYSILILNAAVILPFLVWNVYAFFVTLHTSSVSMSFGSLPVYNQLLRFFLLWVYRFPYFYCLVGIVLGIIHKPKFTSEKE